MIHECCCRRDAFPEYRSYTVRYVDTDENIAEIANWVERAFHGAATVRFSVEDKDHARHSCILSEGGRKIAVPFGSFLVLTAGGHFASKTEKEFFEEYYFL